MLRSFHFRLVKVSHVFVFNNSCNVNTDRFIKRTTQVFSIENNFHVDVQSLSLCTIESKKFKSTCYFRDKNSAPS